jgi:hypothetical protein
MGTFGGNRSINSCIIPCTFELTAPKSAWIVENVESTSILNLAYSSSCNLVADATGAGLVTDAIGTDLVADPTDFGLVADGTCAGFLSSSSTLISFFGGVQINHFIIGWSCHESS